MKQIYHVVTKDVTTTLLDTQSFINFIQGMDLDKCVICVSEVSDDDYALMIRMQSQVDHPHFTSIDEIFATILAEPGQLLTDANESVKIYPNLRSIFGFTFDYHDRRKNGYRHKLGYKSPYLYDHQLQKHLFKQFTNKNGERLCIVSIESYGVGLVVKTQFV